VGWACSACQVNSTRHVTVSSRSQQQRFTLLSRGSDVNFRPSRSTSSQQSALDYPLQSSHMEGSRWDQPQYCDKLCPSPLPLENPPSAKPGADCNSDSANFASALSRQPPPKNGMWGLGLRIRHPSSSPEALGAVCATSLQVTLARYCQQGKSTRLPGCRVPLCTFMASSLISHGPISAGYEARLFVALVAFSAFGFLLITKIDIGRSFLVHAIPVLRNLRPQRCIDMARNTQQRTALTV